MKTLEIIVFNVGHGDNILIKFPDDKYGIIDFNYDNNLNSFKESPSLTYLKRLKRDDIKFHFLHITHYHQDHTLGLNKFFEWVNGEETIVSKQQEPIEINEIWLPDLDRKQPLHQLLENEEILTELKKNNKVTEAKSSVNKSYELDKYRKNKKNKVRYLFKGIELVEDIILPQINFICLAPEVNQIINYSELFYKRNKGFHRNDISTILQFIYKGKKYLFGGDAERKSWRSGINFYKKKHTNTWGKIGSNFIKVSHHGSSNSSSIPYWKEVLTEPNPILAISAGLRNNMEFPNDKTLRQIEAVEKILENNIFIYCTNHKTAPQNYQVEVIDDWPVYEIKNKKRYSDRFGSFAKDIDYTAENRLIGYKFTYNMSTETINVSQLIQR